MSRIYKPTPEQITAWVAKHFDYKPRKNGNELVICNPFDGDDGYHFNISTLKATCHDWRGDEWAGPINPRTRKRSCTFLKFVRLFLDCSYHQAARAVSVAAGSTVAFAKATGRPDGSDGRPEVTEKPLVALPVGCEPLIRTTQKKMASLVMVWLQSRGVSPQLVKAANIHHLGADVIFPYYEYDQLVYWQQRSALNKRFLFPDEQAYGVTKGQFLYNFDKIEPASYLIVTESIFGCFTLGEQCCATGGADMTDMQARKIKLIGPRDGVILSPDNDGAAIKSVIRNGAMLGGRGLPIFLSLPPALPYRDEDGRERTTKDWNELYTKLKMSLDEIREVFEHNIMPLNESTRFKLLGMSSGLTGKPTVNRLPRIPN